MRKGPIAGLFKLHSKKYEGIIFTLRNIHYLFNPDFEKPQERL